MDVVQPDSILNVEQIDFQSRKSMRKLNKQYRRKVQGSMQSKVSF
jgi:hypothetical protein